MFLDDFTNCLSQRLPDYKNVVFTVYFNIHINNQDNDDDALIFLDMMTAIGLQVHNRFPTHRQGNMLDLITSESFSELEVMIATLGPSCQITMCSNVKYVHPRKTWLDKI